ncbi:MAG TPA: hypothetical protein VEV45_20635 [Streptosporangiaceae bacterium]|nr:hypothetical protein [Streptosporangiaceae bacterium]
MAAEQQGAGWLIVARGYHKDRPECQGHDRMMLAEQVRSDPPPESRGWDYIGEIEGGGQLYVEPSCPQHGRMHLVDSGEPGLERWICQGLDGEGCDAAAATSGPSTGTTAAGQTAPSADASGSGGTGSRGGEA